ncbi:class I SAM-dependent methyltransferase [Streptomyces sp. TRM68416]|nr:class I SAM-dependent methyltransferase [Streptomyces sp. TRM68416]
MDHGAGASAAADGSEECMPWDIGEPQPAVVQWQREGTIRGAVLDAGCGLGENAAFLSAHGHRVTGLDSSPHAIERARELARRRGLRVDLAVADAVRLSGYEGRFDTVVDCALFHCLDEEERPRYLRALNRATAPGAQLHLVCFSDALPPGNPELFRISARYVREALEVAGWQTLEVRRGTLLGRVPSAALRKIFVSRFSIDGTTDADNRVHSAAWWVRARRI